MANVYTISNEAMTNFLAELQTTDTAQVAQQLEEFLSKHLKPKAKRGRPSKKTPAADEEPVAADLEEVHKEEEKQKKKRGRPSKKKPVADDEPVPAVVEKVEEVSKEEEKQKKKRGRPSKKSPVVDSGDAGEKEKKEKKPRKEKEEVNADLWGDLEEREFTRMNFQDEKSDKFWECAQEGKVTLVRYGKAGSNGILQQKTFADEETASKFLEKEILAKEKKGYIRA